MSQGRSGGSRRERAGFSRAASRRIPRRHHLLRQRVPQQRNSIALASPTQGLRKRESVTHASLQTRSSSKPRDVGCTMRKVLAMRLSRRFVTPVQFKYHDLDIIRRICPTSVPEGMYLSHICTSVGTKDANNLIQGDRKEIDCTHTMFSKIHR